MFIYFYWEKYKKMFCFEIDGLKKIKNQKQK